MAEWALPHINLDLCNQCGTCADRCPSHAVEMTARGPSFVQPRNCTYCAQCEDVCPQGAITCTYVIVWDSERASTEPQSNCVVCQMERIGTHVRESRIMALRKVNSLRIHATSATFLSLPRSNRRE
jgi:ferredoxin